MLHGAREKFGIEWHLDDDVDRLMPGAVCYWIGGNVVGDASAFVYLADMLLDLAYPVGDCGNRNSGRFCSMEGEEVFRKLYLSLFQSDESLTDLANDETWARFSIGASVPSLDGWFVYLIDCSSYSRLLFGTQEGEPRRPQFLGEQRLPVGYADEVILEFREHLNTVWRSRNESA